MITRPLIRWHGGKYRLAPWVCQFLPAHRFYVEPYGGGASVLLRKPRAYAEVYNDLDETLVNLFRVLRDDAQAARLIQMLELTPFSRLEFQDAYHPTDDPVEQARCTLVRSFMGFGSDGTVGKYRTGFRCNVTRAGTTPSTDWSGYPPALRAIVERLRGVVIECKPAAEVIERFDDVDTLFYVDPPYLPETRSHGNRRRGQGFHVYQHEMDVEDHVALLDRLNDVRGMVVLSGYPSPLYDEMLAGWRREERPAHADGARPRLEQLWLNQATLEALGHGPLFGVVA